VVAPSGGDDSAQGVFIVQAIAAIVCDLACVAAFNGALGFFAALPKYTRWYGSALVGLAALTVAALLLLSGLSVVDKSRPDRRGGETGRTSSFIVLIVLNLPIVFCLYVLSMR
jgi:hypothetical protein